MMMMVEEAPPLCNATLRGVRIMASRNNNADDTTATLSAVFRCTDEPERFQAHFNQVIDDYPSADHIAVSPAQIAVDNDSMCHVDRGIVSCFGLLDESLLDVTVCCPNQASGLLLHTYGSFNTPSSSIDSTTTTRQLLTMDLGFSVVSLDAKTVLFRNSHSRRLDTNPDAAGCRKLTAPDDNLDEFVCRVTDHADMTALFFKF
jgi:hypothetical protein